MDLFNLQHGFDLSDGEEGVTVRNGTKWFDVPIGTELALKVQQAPGDPGVQVGTGVKTGAWIGPFKDLPARLLTLEHNRQARSYVALLEMLERAYPGFTEDHLVTALIYRRTS